MNFFNEQGWVSQTEPRGTTESSTFGEQQFNNWPRTFDQTESFGDIGTGEWCFLQSSTAATNPSLCDGTTSGARGLEASAEKLLRKSNGWKRLPRAKKRRWSERSNDSTISLSDDHHVPFLQISALKSYSVIEKLTLSLEVFFKTFTVIDIWPSNF